MGERILKPLPLTAERFAPYGDVIAAHKAQRAAMNEARFERFDDLARLDIDAHDGGRPAVSIARSRIATKLPYRFDMVERHPRGSQAFIPLTRFKFIVVVGPPQESVTADELEAFVTDGRQGINYRRGTWHMPLIGLEEGQEFLVIDRVPAADNCEERIFDDPPLLAGPG